MPTSTMALMGRFPSLKGRFPTLMGRFPDFVLRGPWKSTWKQPIKKRGIKRFLTLDGGDRAMDIAESLARVVAAIRISSVRWQSYLPLGIVIRGVPWQGGTGLDAYQICIQARYDTYQIPFLV